MLQHPRSCGWCPNLERYAASIIDHGLATGFKSGQKKGEKEDRVDEKRNVRRKRPYLEKKHCHDSPCFISIEEKLQSAFISLFHLPFKLRKFSAMYVVQRKQFVERQTLTMAIAMSLMKHR